MNLDIPTKEPAGILRLLSLRGVGPKSAIALAKRFSTISQIVEADDFELRQVVNGSVISTLRNLQMWYSAYIVAEKIFDKSASHSIRVLSYFCSDYPSLLKLIPDRPPILYVKGKLRNDDRYVACVGTREPSYFGKTVAQRMAKMLVESGWGIVSGLAIGVDTESHAAALDAGGYTVSILANGLDSVYPKKNERLAERILEAGGALISEQPVGTRALGPNLVQRDRLQSGLSIATFVMQTDIVGGTMHTVRFTLQQGRLLFVPVPTEKFSDEEKNRGILALAELTGRDFAERVKAEGTYRDLLLSKFASRSPAIPVRNQSDYQFVLNHLSVALDAHRANDNVLSN
jgi:DNA processing protein